MDEHGAGGRDAPTSDEAFDRLTQAATRAKLILQRVGGEGGIVEAIEQREWLADLQSEEATEIASVLEALAEYVRHARATIGSVDLGQPQPSAQGALRATIAAGLPLNRKERFYTGTVLPMLIASDGFAHLHRFLALCGLEIEPLGDHGLDGMQPIEFFSEYNYSESRFTKEDTRRFPDAPVGADTPDLVVVGPDWLVAVEAKMFHDPLPVTLNAQMGRQRVLVDYWQRALRLSPERVAHVLLLPEQLPITGVEYPVVTWQTVLEQYRVVGPAYWAAMLGVALERYADLKPRVSRRGINAHGHLTGQEIVDRHADNELEFTHVGRNRGLDGGDFAEDIFSGRWRSQVYEVRRVALPGARNWFPIADFIARTASSASLLDHDPGAHL